MKKILITGSSGFIGRNVTKKLAKQNYDITAIIRPETDSNRIQGFADSIRFEEINLARINSLRNFLSNNSFDLIYHIGALRGGRKFSKQDFYTTNVKATEQIIISALKNNTKLIFCSSVGIFGAIPYRLPADNNTKRKADNYYHYTKIQAEKLIQKYVKQGLNAVIVRPSITYGTGDYGFPYTLTKLIDKKLLFLSKQKIKIHLTNIDFLSDVFTQLAKYQISSGRSYIVADAKPVEIHELADFINNEINNTDYPKYKNINRKFFRLGESISRLLGSELWTSRFELISRDWFYKIDDVQNDFDLKLPNTIPAFKIVTNWYKKEDR